MSKADALQTLKEVERELYEQDQLELVGKLHSLRAALTEPPSLPDDTHIHVFELTGGYRGGIKLAAALDREKAELMVQANYASKGEYIGTFADLREQLSETHVLDYTYQE